MFTESTIAPSAVSVELNGDVLLTENAILIDKDGVGIYQYDSYRINVPYRDGLKAQIESNFDEWIAYAKSICAMPKPLTIPEKVELHDSEIGNIVTVLEAIV